MPRGGPNRDIAIWLAAGVAVSAALLGFLWWGIGAPPLSGPGSPGAGDRPNVVKIALTTTGGIGGVIFLVIAYRKLPGGAG